MMKTNTTPYTKQSREQGFSLLEVLVTSLILIIGIMGLMGSQLAALKMNQAATSRSIASEYAYAMMDKIRANSAEARNGAYDINLLTAASAVGTGTSVAHKERKLWADQLNRALPGALVQLCRKTNVDGTYTSCGSTGDFFMVRVAWQQGVDDKLAFDATNAGSTDSQSVEIVGRI
jgi:type IV pilus assembly protein PilV